MTSRPNILLIMVDQMSATSLGLYGNTVVRTPALERLAESGVLFEHSYCNYPACTPSRCSMMTGRYTSTLRNHANFMLLDPEETSLPLVLRRAGYETALIGKNHCFLDGDVANDYPDRPAHHCADGTGGASTPDELHTLFDYVFQGDHIGVQDQEDDPELDAAIKWGREHSWGQQHSFSKNPYPADKSVTHALCTHACNYLESVLSKDCSFFLWLSIPDPHTPYQVSSPYAEMYDPAAIPPPIHDTLENKPERQKVAHLLDQNHLYDDRHFQELRAIHYGMINQIDDGLARVLDVVDSSGQRDNTVIVFTADHGDAMGDHGQLQKHNFFYDSFCRVPLLISQPGAILPRRVGGLAELVDVMPTLLDLAEIEIPPGVQGASHAALLRGESEHTKEFIVVESGDAGDPVSLAEIHDEAGNLLDKGTSFAWCAFREAWLGRGKCLRDARWKLCVYANGEGELYDMLLDPDELVNLYGQPEVREIESELKYKLLRWCMDSEDTLPRNRRAGPWLPIPAPAPPPSS